MNKYTYKILEHNNDPLKALIEKRGITTQFTLGQLETEEKQYQMMIDKYKSERSVDAAKMENVEHFHPVVKELDPQQLLAVWMWQESKTGVDVCDQKIAEFEEELALVRKTKKEIAKKLGLRSKEQAVDEAVAKITEPEHG